MNTTQGYFEADGTGSIDKALSVQPRAANTLIEFIVLDKTTKQPVSSPAGKLKIKKSVGTIDETITQDVWVDFPKEYDLSTDTQIPPSFCAGYKYRFIASGLSSTDALFVVVSNW